ncbi:uncharacterized protein DS421_18g606260 [Arachis hypogaea]|nr:uncharacterized protein DS421_18g606260 [Arachis hypogaea]
MAADKPAGPAPTTTTSYSLESLASESVAKLREGGTLEMEAGAGSEECFEYGNMRREKVYAAGED